MDLSTLIEDAWDRIRENKGRTLLVGLAAILVWYVPDWGFVKSEISGYSGQCRMAVKANSCSSHQAVYPPTTYKVAHNSQTVMYWTADTPPRKYDDCVVVNLSNWSCTLTDSYSGSWLGTVGFASGRYISDFGRYSERVFTFPRWRYLVYKAQRQPPPESAEEAIKRLPGIRKKRP